MKKTISVILLILIIAISKISAQNNNFYVRIEQDSVIYNLDEPVLNLKKIPFTVIFEFNEPMSVFVNSSFSPVTYSKIKRGIIIDKIEAFNGQIVKDNIASDDLFISKDKSDTWFCNSNTDKNFSRCFKKNKKIVAVKEINTFIIEYKNIVNKIENAEFDLYLSFVTFETDTVTGEKTEFQREAVKIHWK